MPCLEELVHCWTVSAAAEVLGAGMTFPHMYRKCREQFLVTNEVALRSHLTEFRDHQLVVTRCVRFAAGALTWPGTIWH